MNPQHISSFFSLMEYVPSFSKFAKRRGIRTLTSMKFVAFLVNAVQEGVLHKNALDEEYDCIGYVLVCKAAVYCEAHPASGRQCLDLIRRFMSFEPDVAYIWVCLNYRYHVRSRDFLRILPDIEYLWCDDCSVQRYVRNFRDIRVQRHHAVLQDIRSTRWSPCRFAWMRAVARLEVWNRNVPCIGA